MLKFEERYEEIKQNRKIISYAIPTSVQDQEEEDAHKWWTSHKCFIEKNNWKTTDKKNVKNVDLWKKLKELVQYNQVEWNWVKGHSENPMNDLADKLAKRATPV